MENNVLYDGNASLLTEYFSTKKDAKIALFCSLKHSDTYQAHLFNQKNGSPWDLILLSTTKSYFSHKLSNILSNSLRDKKTGI